MANACFCVRSQFSLQPSSRKKAWVTMHTVRGEKGVLPRPPWCGRFLELLAAFLANIRFAFSFGPQVLRRSYTPPFSAWLFSTTRQRTSVLVCFFTLRAPTPFPPGSPAINIYPNVFNLCPAQFAPLDPLSVPRPSSRSL